MPYKAGKNSPLTPLLPMEQSSFDFSPSAIARCLNRNSTTPKCIKTIVSASLKNDRSFSPFLLAQEVSFDCVSPIEGSSEYNNILCYPVPTKSPASPRIMTDAAVDGFTTMTFCGTTNNLSA